MVTSSVRSTCFGICRNHQLNFLYYRSNELPQLNFELLHLLLPEWVHKTEIVARLKDFHVCIMKRRLLNKRLES